MTRTRGALKSIQKADRIVQEAEEVVEDVDTYSDFTVKSLPPEKSRRKSQAFGVPKTAALKAK